MSSNKVGASKKIKDKELRELILNFSENLRRLRKESDMSRPVLSNASKVSESMISEIEQLRVMNFSAKVLVKLARGLELEDPLKLLKKL